MIDLIFIIILAVFIGGMLKCDAERDRSRMLRPYQKKALDDACNAFKGLGIAAHNCAGKSALFHQAVGRSKRTKRFAAGPMDFSEMFNSDLIISNADFTESEKP